MNESIRTYDIAREYTPYPAGRYKKNGPGSGEGFREIIKEELEKGNKIRLVMDGTYGYGSSFLEEAFGGLVREHVLSANEIEKRLEFDTADELLRSEIKGYIADAAQVAAQSE